MIAVNNSLYISSNEYLYKTDENLKIISQYYSQSAFYRGLYYNSSSNLIYVAGNMINEINIFDQDLNLNDTISTSFNPPWSIQGYKNYIYVGTTTGKLFVIENKDIIQIFVVCSGSYLTSIVIDHFGYMALSCNTDQKVYFYYSANLSYTGINVMYEVEPYFINFDSHGRFVVISRHQVDIYY